MAYQRSHTVPAAQGRTPVRPPDLIPDDEHAILRRFNGGDVDRPQIAGRILASPPHDFDLNHDFQHSAPPFKAVVHDDPPDEESHWDDLPPMHGYPPLGLILGQLRPHKLEPTWVWNEC